MVAADNEKTPLFGLWRAWWHRIPACWCICADRQTERDRHLQLGHADVQSVCSGLELDQWRVRPVGFAIAAPEDGPQLPSGYPGMAVLALIPPLWFAVMNPKVRAYYAGEEHQLGVDQQPT